MSCLGRFDSVIERFIYNYSIIILEVVKMETITKPRKWGNSLGVTIPQNIVNEEGITLKDELVINIRKKTDIRNLRGLFKFKKPAQEIKDEMRSSWE